MKILITLMMYVISENIYSIDCSNYCPQNKKYNYTVCNFSTNKIQRICSDSPNSLQAPLYPMKANLPVCLDFIDDEGPSEVTQLTTTGLELVIYQKSKILQDLNNSTKMWNCLCNKENDACACTISIKFTSNPSDFGGNNPVSDILGQCQFRMGSGCTTTCGPGVGNNVTKIYLNNTSNFTGSLNSNINGERKKFFVNDFYFDQNINYLDDIDPNHFKAYSLSDIIAHELGHALGFDHHDDSNGNSTCPPFVNSGLMNTATKANTPRIGLQQDDKCQFVSLYCPNLLSIENVDNNLKLMDSYYLQDDFTLDFVVGDIINSKLEIFDIFGKKLNDISYDKIENKNISFKIEVNNYINGIYFYVFINNGKVINGKFIIHK